jgi:hypothetical protein
MRRWANLAKALHDRSSRSVGRRIEVFRESTRPLDTHLSLNQARLKDTVVLDFFVPDDLNRDARVSIPAVAVTS